MIDYANAFLVTKRQPYRGNRTFGHVVSSFVKWRLMRGSPTSRPTFPDNARSAKKKPACCAGFETGRRRNAPPNGLARPTTNLLLSGSTGS
ncbi:hypothetical protein X888_4304 [Burkholderia pseudomallei MSHR4377]|nr:hypothetical protein JE55_5132 [Burkholderia pseudomallei]KGS21043.1 hypothetical protein X962_5536 [Burkholderia pseudomallei MSHR7343]KGS45215.1 hypothetical protein X945_2957 [Burkholderia pseudomallei ABCPW 107]KGS86453.1 hypothetical protein X942_2377 [Burkholderia pseudomallei MSHR5596]KGU81321.1 hypothetical protein Y038_5118 [Burkholderia pseudomallei MSHR543]KGV05167.1 hypothetical protein X888_4304 [Burkholderia pseudomallei MSHR4377]KGV22773.1 hypothetical protein X881_3897 [Bur